MQTNNLLQAIQTLAPRLDSSQLYSTHDLISEVYLKAHSLQLTADDTDQLKKLIREANFQKYRVKYPRHSTANYTAEELVEYCSHLLAHKPSPEADPEPSLWDYLRAGLSQLEAK